MTCIVGLVDNGTVYIGGDSAALFGWDLCIRSDKKVVAPRPGMASRMMKTNCWPLATRLSVCTSASGFKHARWMPST
jgi:hypothetical protein